MSTLISSAQTLSFDEPSNSFESFLSFAPEMMCTLGNTLVSFKDGDLYTHDSDTYNNFYGVDYPSYITLVFNKNVSQIKNFVAIDERGNIMWECPEIETSLITNPDTIQQSNLVSGDFDTVEGKYVAALLRDLNSIGGIIEGDSLQGGFIKIKFQVLSASDLVTLNEVLLRYTNSPLN